MQSPSFFYSLIKKPKSFAFWIFQFLLLAHLTACGAASVKNHEGNTIAPYQGDIYTLNGVIDYKGNQAYLPKSLKPSEESGLLLKYSYQVDQSAKQTHIANVFNPFLFFGVPTGKEAMAVTGFLEVYAGETLLKSYRETVFVDTHTRLFSNGGTGTERRQRGLKTVSGVIDHAIYQDKDFYETLQQEELASEVNQ